MGFKPFLQVLSQLLVVSISNLLCALQVAFGQCPVDLVSGVLDAGRAF
jgi:hypothetical protein